MRKRTAIQYAILTSVLVMLFAVTGLGVLQPVPEESGVSGFVNIGTAYMEAKTNMFAGNELISIGDDTVGSIFGNPDTDHEMIPMINGELRYTFGDSRTQIYFGNQMEDVLTFDAATLLGVRKELGDKGTGAISYVFNGIVTEVWEDPYVENAKRTETNRESKGIRLEWDRLYGTNVGVEYQWRKIDIDDEFSGTLGGLGLTPAEIGQLDREGDSQRGEVYYTWRLGGGHSLVPAFRFGKNDLDGDAMASDVYAIRLNYAYRSEKYSIVVTGHVGNEEFDKTNPIYTKTREDDVYGIGVTALLHQPFGWPEGMSLAGTVGYYEADSNIDFYNSEVLMVGTSVLYNF
ncbi:MAG: DUF2860 family protein [Planctomycetota bacterium]|jgi:hypothetical protein